MTILRSNGMHNTFTEAELLIKMKTVTVTTQNVLVTVNNFHCMRQQKAENVGLYLGRLKVEAQHCYLTLPPGKTSYTEKMVMHTLVQGLENAAITKDVMEEYATDDNLHNRLTSRTC